MSLQVIVGLIIILTSFVESYSYKNTDEQYT